MTIPMIGDITTLSVCCRTITDPVESDLVQIAHRNGVLVATPNQSCPDKENCFEIRRRRMDVIQN